VRKIVLACLSLIALSLDAQSASIEDAMADFEQKLDSQNELHNQANKTYNSTKNKSDLSRFCQLVDERHKLIQQNWGIIKTFEKHYYKTKGMNLDDAITRRKSWIKTTYGGPSQVTERYLDSIAFSIYNYAYCRINMKSKIYPTHGKNGDRIYPLLYWPRDQKTGLKKIVTSNCEFWGLKSEPGGFGTKSCYLLF
jgi:hypothetical protein